MILLTDSKDSFNCLDWMDVESVMQGKGWKIDDAVSLNLVD